MISPGNVGKSGLLPLSGDKKCPTEGKIHHKKLLVPLPKAVAIS